MKAKSGLVFALFYSQIAHAGVCELTIERIDCPGKKFEALQPFEGENPTHEKLKLETEAICLEKAEKPAKIIRRQVLSKKTVTAKFDGKDLGKTFTDSVPCK